jgi:hypothetical protein
MTDLTVYTPNAKHSFSVCCGGSAEENFLDASDSVLGVVDNGGNIIPLTFSAVGPTASQRYASPYTVPNANTNIFFSFTQNYIAYSVYANGSSNPAIWQINFSSTSTGPTTGNGAITQVVDLSTCVAALAGVGNGVYYDDVGVSGDDQTFTTSVATTAGQGSTGAIYAIIWNRTLGCRVWNMNTNTISGSYGSSPTGSVNFISDGVTAAFTGSSTEHNIKLGKGGTWVKVACQSCSVANFLWNINTLNIYEMWDDSTGGAGHSAIGYSLTTNQGSTNANGNTYHNQGLMSRPSNNTGNYTFLPCVSTGSCWPAANQSSIWDAHLSWNNDNSSDTAPVFITEDLDQFAVNVAWDNEILGYQMGGNGVAYRFAHSYATGQSWSFSGQNAIGNVSADGKYYLWTSDWDGLLGNTDGSTSSCTITTNCRTDVFLAILPLQANGSAVGLTGGGLKGAGVD